MDDLSLHCIKTAANRAYVVARAHASIHHQTKQLRSFTRPVHVIRQPRTIGSDTKSARAKAVRSDKRILSIDPGTLLSTDWSKQIGACAQARALCVDAEYTPVYLSEAEQWK